MKTFVERVKYVLNKESITRNNLADKSGLSYTRINNALNERGHFRPDEAARIAEVFPPYEHWILTGKELPEAGQISPDTKQVLQDYK